MRQDDPGGDTNPLYVPEGFALVAVKIDFSRGARRGALTLPSLFDTLNDEYHPVGILARYRKSRNSPRTIEFAYSAYDGPDLLSVGRRATTPFPTKFMGGAGAIATGTATVFYLVNQTFQPTGLLGVRRIRDGHVWRLEKGVDVVLVPPRE